MSGTVDGGSKASITNRRKYGSDFYRVIGARGGAKKSPLKGFGGDRERARIAGAKGGRISRRGKAKRVQIPVQVVE